MVLGGEEGEGGRRRGESIESIAKARRECEQGLLTGDCCLPEWGPFAMVLKGVRLYRDMVWDVHVDLDMVLVTVVGLGMLFVSNCVYFCFMLGGRALKA